MSSGAGSAHVLLTWFLVFLVAFLVTCFHVGCLLETKMHMGFLLRQYHCPLATRGVSEKGSHVARPQSTKVPTRGFSAKKETVWRDLPAIFHNSAKKEGGWRNLSKESADLWIFGKKGSRVARPPCHFPQLGEKGRCVAQPQQGKVPTRGFSAKKETVWRDL